MSVQRSFSLVLPAAVVLSTFAMAKAAPAPAPAPPAVPAAQQEAANNNLSVNEPYGDWTVRCFMVKSVAPCDVLQVATNQQTKQRILLASIAYIPSRDAFAMQLIVPLGVALAKGMSIDITGKPLGGITFNRCEADGCYVEMQIPNETIQAMTSGLKATTISLTPYGKTAAVKLPLSLNGFGDAVNKLKGYAKEKASAPPPATP